MKYVALLSGGKDSCFNLLHCSENGHELVAAASLRPEQGKDEIDSYMYQTVGQDAIEVVAKALDVPLYRRVIAGDAVHQGSEYGARAAQGTGDLKGDETEDLYELLSTVLEHHPEVKGVSVGAILSNYQRVRVEHVCRRLGLTSLAYLWQRDQAELLSEMIEAGLTAVLIKVAGIGLTVKHLGKTLQEMQPTLTKLNTLYGSHVCGEGGEYETLTIDSPMFKSRIVLKDVETVIHSDNDFATVAYLRVKEAELEPKEVGSEAPILSVPPLLEEKYSELLEEDLEAGHDISSLSLEEKSDLPRAAGQDLVFPTRSRKVQDWISVASVQRAAESADMSIEEEVTECFKILANELRKHDLEVYHCANINIFLSSINDFARVNAVYGSFFGTSPPARACVAVTLPEGIRVRLDAIAFAEHKHGERQAHHVQGLSYWAPANIGPYSQAILAQEQVFVSGQIGLIPSSLALAESLQLQTALSCQHASRILEALASNSGSNWSGIPRLNIYWFDSPGNLCSMKNSSLVKDDGDVPTLFVSVAALPKGAKIEKQTLVHTGRAPPPNDEDDEEDEVLVQKTSSDLLTSSDTSVRIQSRALGPYIATLICGAGELPAEFTPRLKASLGDPLSARLFHNPARISLATCHSNVAALDMQDVPTTDIPCSFISSSKEDGWHYAICILSQSCIS